MHSTSGAEHANPDVAVLADFPEFNEVTIDHTFASGLKTSLPEILVLLAEVLLSIKADWVEGILCLLLYILHATEFNVVVLKS